MLPEAVGFGEKCRIYGGVIATNSTFTGNSAYGGTGTGLVFGGYGGGISGSGMLTNCTVSGNTCQVFAGGLANGVDGDGGGGGISGDLTLNNTIVAGNTSTETTYTGTETSENDMGVTTGLASPSFPYFAVEPLVFLRHVEVPEGIPLAIEVGGS